MYLFMIYLRKILFNKYLYIIYEKLKIESYSPELLIIVNHLIRMLKNGTYF